MLCLLLCISSCDDDKKYTDEEMLEKVHSHGHDVNFNGIIDGVYCKANADGTVAKNSCELGADGEIYKYDGNSISYAYASISKIPYGKGDSLCIKLWPIKKRRMEHSKAGCAWKQNSKHCMDNKKQQDICSI